MEYRYRSTEKLIEDYIFEYGRKNDEDRKRTQKLIKQELLERANRLIRVLEDEENIKFDLKNRTIEEEAQAIIKWVVLQK
jgi:hypothetical protein